MNITLVMDIVSVFISLLTINNFITAGISSLVAAIAIMLSSEIIEHNLEFKHAISIAVAASLAASFLTPVVESILGPYIPTIFIGSQTLAALAINLAFWLALSMVILTQSFMNEKIKIAIYGFIVTTIVLEVLPVILPLVGL